MQGNPSPIAHLSRSQGKIHLKWQDVFLPSIIGWKVSRSKESIASYITISCEQELMVCYSPTRSNGTSMIIWHVRGSAGMLLMLIERRDEEDYVEYDATCSLHTHFEKYQNQDAKSKLWHDNDWKKYSITILCHVTGWMWRLSGKFHPTNRFWKNNFKYAAIPTTIPLPSYSPYHHLSIETMWTNVTVITSKFHFESMPSFHHHTEPPLINTITHIFTHCITFP